MRQVTHSFSVYKIFFIKQIYSNSIIFIEMFYITQYIFSFAIRSYFCNVKNHRNVHIWQYVI